MAFEYGFYNSIAGDRKYNANQFGQIFDGIIEDGVFQSIGDKFFTTASTGMDIIVGTGKAWFDHTWNLNTTKMPFTLSASHPVLTRYDTVVMEINESQDAYGRVNCIKVVEGTPSSNAVKPELTNTEYIHQYPLAYVKINPEVTSITAADIEIVVGQDPCPFVTGILETTDITGLFANWESQFNTWFDNLKEQLTGDIVTNLQNQINNCLKNSDIANSDDMENGTEGKVVTADLLKNYGFDSMYKVGDIIETNRTDLSDKWLYCNGEPYDPEEYPELASVLGNNLDHPYGYATLVGDANNISNFNWGIFNINVYHGPAIFCDHYLIRTRVGDSYSKIQIFDLDTFSIRVRSVNYGQTINILNYVCIFDIPENDSVVLVWISTRTHYVGVYQSNLLLDPSNSNNVDPIHWFSGTVDGSSATVTDFLGIFYYNQEYLYFAKGSNVYYFRNGTVISSNVSIPFTIIAGSFTCIDDKIYCWSCKSESLPLQETKQLIARSMINYSGNVISEYCAITWAGVPNFISHLSAMPPGFNKDTAIKTITAQMPLGDNKKLILYTTMSTNASPYISLYFMINLYIDGTTNITDSIYLNDDTLLCRICTTSGGPSIESDVFIYEFTNMVEFNIYNDYIYAIKYGDTHRRHKGDSNNFNKNVQLTFIHKIESIMTYHVKDISYIYSDPIESFPTYFSSTKINNFTDMNISMIPYNKNTIIIYSAARDSFPFSVYAFYMYGTPFIRSGRGYIKAKS